jgi:hypothetical protein
MYSGRAGQLRVVAPRFEGSITLDGVLDEPEWRAAARLTGFAEYTPVDGGPAEDSTEVLVWYSGTAIYFGIRAFASHSAVHATLADRDKIAADDYVQILLDTFNDHRQALAFGVNPLGVQADGILNEGNRSSVNGFGAAIQDTVDLSADFVFQSKGRITADGYEMEVRIPFKSVRYQPGRRRTGGSTSSVRCSTLVTGTPGRRPGAPPPRSSASRGRSPASPIYGAGWCSISTPKPPARPTAQPGPPAGGT